MASSNSCLIHFDGKKGPLTSFSAVSFQKFLDCRSIWLTLDGEHRDVAQRSLKFVKENVKNLVTESIEYKNFSYHRACYSALTNIGHIKRAQVRCQDKNKKCEEAGLSLSASIIEAEPEDIQPAKKILRSTLRSACGSAATSSAVTSRNPHVLPQLCIICKSEKSYFTESKSKKRKLDKLVSAETVDGGKLREAATRKGDGSILIQINDKDMVALEVKYHKHCYERYTSVLRHNTNVQETEKQESKYEKSFDVFCKEFVNEKLIKQDNIFYMRKLKKEFIKTVQRVESENASSYRSFRLKKRLCKRFPQLVFHRPRVRSKSEIVYSECLSRASVAESFIEKNEETSQSSQESGTDFEIDDEGSANIAETKKASLKELYTVGMTLKSDLQDKTSTWYENWPPLASDITAENVNKLVPHRLFNFMAWLLGFSDDPEDAEYIALNKKKTATIFSLCQDLVYVASGGKNRHLNL